MALVGPITETIEARWVSRKISDKLRQMRMHVRSAAAGIRPAANGKPKLDVQPVNRLGVLTPIGQLSY
jgi:hypothetical protein